MHSRHSSRASFTDEDLKHASPVQQKSSSWSPSSPSVRTVAGLSYGRLWTLVALILGVALFSGHAPSYVAKQMRVYPCKPEERVLTTTCSRLTSRPSFHELGIKHGTDKVTTHRYHRIYDRVLAPYRSRHVRVVEIGLGCDMPYGPGKSVNLWLDYFDDVELHFIEYDEACATEWAPRLSKQGVTIHSGDQSDPVFLTRFLSEVGDFDILIDDGGHTMHQQLVSLNNLFGAVKSGGLYIIEDLQTSYWIEYGGGANNVTLPTNTIGFIKELVDDLNVRTSKVERKHPVSEYLEGIYCMEEICTLFKE